MNARSVTPRDRAHFATIAEAKVSEKAEQIRAAAADGTANGILIGLELARLATSSPAIERLEERRADGQFGLHQRWLDIRGARTTG